jgi:alkanesulfonate monooxygenase
VTSIARLVPSSALENLPGGVDVFATCAQSKLAEPNAYRRHVVEVARWSEAGGCRGVLVYTDNGLVDPWLVAQLIIQSTSTLSPLVAVQPVYMHPFTAAKMVASLGLLHGRRVYLNMVAGGFKNDLVALDDHTEHDERYDRLTEYTLIVEGLLSSPGPFSFEGTYYRVKNLSMTPKLPRELFPGLMVSGSSAAGLAAAESIGATAVRYPKPPGDEDHISVNGKVRAGCRVGIITRERDDEAWRIAHERFPEDRKGQMTHQLAMKVSDSQWHHQLSKREPGSPERSPYWLGPFKNYKTFCPYLVGSYATVAEILRGYIDRGFRSFILDVPPDGKELGHTGVAFREALNGVRK